MTFNNVTDKATLVGTLSYPIGYKKGHTPVVSMVTGSGQENRDEEVFDHKPFLVIADYLARHGVATLRYDDRGLVNQQAEMWNMLRRLILCEMQ